MIIITFLIFFYELPLNEPDVGCKIITMKYLLFTLAIFIYGFVSYDAPSLNNKEEEGILYMREEEKLARDVYETMFEKYNSNPFGNIRYSEQRHMDRMEVLINTYKLSDPVKLTKDERGKFVNAGLQKLYNDLVKKGNVSFVEALKVGAAVEEIDIADLKKELAKTDKEDIRNVYTALMQASEHHLNAFAGKLKMQGLEYKPVALSQKEFDDIIANDSRGMGKGNGQGQGKGACNEKGNDGCGNQAKGGCCGQCK